MRTKLVNDALLLAIWQRKPSKGLILHTDRGSHNTPPTQPSGTIAGTYHYPEHESRKGYCWDNAALGCFLHTLKRELVHHQHYQTRAEAKQDIFEYIEVFYNRERLHSTDNYLSPVDYEMQLKSA